MIKNVSGYPPLLAALAWGAGPIVLPNRSKERFKLMKRLSLSCAVVVFLMAGSAMAASLSPAVLLPGGTVSNLPDFEDFGDILATINTTFGTGNSIPSGPFNESVITNTQDNPFGNQFLTFAFAFRVTRGDVVELSLPGFSGFSTAVKECTVCNTGTPALDATRSINGDVVSFDFTGIPANGNNTASLAIYTNAQVFADPMITFTDINGGVAPLAGLLPAQAPEPGSLGLLGTAMLALGALRCRRERHRQKL
jgi:hypothetical protein